MMPVRAQVVACGGYLPERVFTNDDLTRYVATSDHWIQQRTGIRERRIAAAGETTADMATRAARTTLDRAGFTASDLDLIVLATATPDETFPATATMVQARLGMTRGAAFDVHAVCTGFIYALSVADAFLKTGQARTALVIGAETFSRILDWTDRSTCVLFGDGAGAVLLQAAPLNEPATDRGVLSTHIYSDGRHHDALYVDGGPSRTQTVGCLRMEGKEVFRHAIHRMAEASDAALAANGKTAADLDWLVPHQANMRIIEGMARRLELSMDHVVATVDRHANTSAASIPLALFEAVEDGRIRPGHLVLLDGMGGGFTWGSALIRW